MSPRPLDLKIVRERLALLAQLLADLRRLPAETFEGFTADWRNVPTAESLVRRAVETVFDVARHLLSSSFGMGSLEYRQVAISAAERGLIRDPELGARFANIAGFRNRLVHHYEDVTSEELHRVVRDHLGDLDLIAEELREAAVRLHEDQGASPR